MHNIASLNRTHRAITRLNRRANRIERGKNATKNHLTLERRKQFERRKYQIAVSTERRKHRNFRRKPDNLSQNAEHSSRLSDTVGKHINTEA